MSCKLLVLLSAFVVVATAMSVRSIRGGQTLSGEPVGRQQSSKGGEPQYVPISYGTDPQKPSLSTEHEPWSKWRQSMSVASSGRSKMPPISSAVVMSTDYLQTLGIEPHGVIAESGRRTHIGKANDKQGDADIDTFSQTDNSDKLDRMGMKESAMAPVKKTAPESPLPSQRCCMPAQFEAILVSHIGTIGERKLPRSGVSLTLMSYDYTNKKLHLMYPDMHGEMYRILIDFSKTPATSYTVMDDGSCQCTPMWGNMVPWCTPVGAHLASGLSLTGSGDNVNMFVSAESPVSMTLTRKSDCVFLMTSRTAGNPGTKYASMTFTTYMNVTMGISNSEKMKIPHACNCTSNV